MKPRFPSPRPTTEATEGDSSATANAHLPAPGTTAAPRSPCSRGRSRADRRRTVGAGPPAAGCPPRHRSRTSAAFRLRVRLAFRPSRTLPISASFRISRRMGSRIASLRTPLRTIGSTAGRERGEQEVPHAVLRERLVDQPVNLVAVGGDEAHDPIRRERRRVVACDGVGFRHERIFEPRAGAIVPTHGGP